MCISIPRFYLRNLQQNAAAAYRATAHSLSRHYVGNITCSLFSLGTHASQLLQSSHVSHTHLADVFIQGNLSDQGGPITHDVDPRVYEYCRQWSAFCCDVGSWMTCMHVSTPSPSPSRSRFDELFQKFGKHCHNDDAWSDNSDTNFVATNIQFLIFYELMQSAGSQIKSFDS